MPRLLKDLLFLAFAAFIVGIVTLANRHGTLGVFRFLHHIPHFDKIGHFILMGILAFLSLQAFVPRMKASPGSATRNVVTILLTLIALAEATQAFNPNRSFSIPDYFFSIAGVFTAAGIYRLLNMKSRGAH